MRRRRDSSRKRAPGRYMSFSSGGGPCSASECWRITTRKSGFLRRTSPGLPGSNMPQGQSYSVHWSILRFAENLVFIQAEELSLHFSISGHTASDHLHLPVKIILAFTSSFVSTLRDRDGRQHATQLKSRLLGSLGFKSQTYCLPAL